MNLITSVDSSQKRALLGQSVFAHFILFNSMGHFYLGVIASDHHQHQLGHRDHQVESSSQWDHFPHGKNPPGELSPNIGSVQLIDPDDYAITGFTPEQALDLLFQRYRARMMELHEPQATSLEDLSERELGELCGKSASLECGKEVLKYLDQRTDSAVHVKCSLRTDFLDCIDFERKSCREEAEKGIYPRLPPKSLIRVAQSRIWRALWTSGGCVLSH